jgi:hypothetical protein
MSYNLLRIILAIIFFKLRLSSYRGEICILISQKNIPTIMKIFFSILLKIDMKPDIFNCDSQLTVNNKEVFNRLFVS